MMKDFLTYIQNTLGEKYLVCSEEKTDYDPSKNLAILSEYSGVNYKSAFVYTYQLATYTNNIEDTMNELQMWAFQNNDIWIQTSEFPFVKVLAAAPVNTSNFDIARVEYVGSITINITLIATNSTTDISYIEINNVMFECTKYDVAYSGEVSSMNVSNENINVSNVGRSTLVHQFIIPATSDATTIFRDHIYGTTKKNTTYTLKIYFNDGTAKTINSKIRDVSFSTERGALPIYVVSFIK